jgi:hypothetical protein
MSATASRRGILAGSAAALLAPAMAPIADAVASGASEAEARLLALRLAALQAFDAHGASVTLFNRADEAGDDEAAALHDEQADAAWDAREAALFAMAEIPASSLAGLAAKADFAHLAVSQGASVAELRLMRSVAADTARVFDNAAPPSSSSCGATRLDEDENGRHTVTPPSDRLARLLADLSLDNGTLSAPPETWAQIGERGDRRVAMACAAAAIPARTAGDLHAKTRALRTELAAVHGGPPDRLATVSEHLAWSVAADVLAGRGAA